MKTLKQWHIVDWTNKPMFPEKTFIDFEDGEDFLCGFFENNNMGYEEWRGEYYIELKEEA